MFEMYAYVHLRVAIFRCGRTGCERDGPFAVFAVPLRNQICILSRGPFLLDGLHTCKRVSVRHETQPSRTIYLFGDVCWINVFLSDE